MPVSGGLDIRINWMSRRVVSSPELAVTWAQYEIWVDGRCVTQVEIKDGDLRRSVFGSLYPLAEWIVANCGGTRHIPTTMICGIASLTVQEEVRLESADSVP